MTNNGKKSRITNLEGKQETKTGVIHKAEKGGYGRKVDINKPEHKATEPVVKRGRGRPKKDSDSDTGEVKKWDTDELSRWIVGSKPKTLPGKTSVKHKLKDSQFESWEHELSQLLNEGLTVTTSTGQQGLGDSVSVSATDEHAQTLIKILNDAGLTSGSGLSTSNNDGTLVEPVTSDEVMSQLSSDDIDDTGEDAMAFLKNMLSNRMSPDSMVSSEIKSAPDYADEKSSTCYNSDDDQEKIKEEDDVEEGNKFTGNLAKARAAGKKEADLDGDGDMEPVREEEQTCNECGALMEEDHECDSTNNEELHEWANTPNGDIDDKGFKAELDFMTKYISGGLNKIKQDQTVMPNTRAKVDMDQSNMAELMRKLKNIN